MRPHLYGLATVAIAVALVCGVNAAQQANPAQAALRSAMDTEVVDGDVASAIKQYQAIVEKYGKADRVTAATALVRLGGCYQKLGDTQARAAYNRVLRDFGDVKEAASAARSHLSELDARSRTPVRGGLALRRIYDGPGLDWCNGLSSDARHLSHVDWLTGNIAIAELTSGTVRPVTTTGSINQRNGLKAFFSPDGRFIACSGGTAPDPTKSDILVMAADGSQQSELVRHPADDGLLGWASDGSRVYFWSDRTGAGDVWSAGVENSRPRGVATLTKSQVGGVMPVRLLRDTLFYLVRSEMRDIHIASVDSASGQLRSPFSPARRYASSSNYAPDWSPDGRFIAYRTIQGGSDSWANPPATIGILDVQTGDQRVIRPDIGGIDPNDGPHWSPDGRSLLVIGKQNTPYAGLYQVDATTSATMPLVKVPRGQWLLYAAWSRDGGSVFYTIGSPTRIVRHDIATGATTDLVRIETSPAGVPRLAASPDGRSLAFVAREPANRMMRTINLVPTDGGGVREIYRTGLNEGIAGLSWTPDGRYLVFRRSFAGNGQSNRPPKSEFWRVAPDGSGAERTDSDVPGIVGPFSFSPDGQRLAVTMGEIKTELWALENLSKAVKDR